jgi:soluble lytic murein transglycosylase-like protein
MALGDVSQSLAPAPQSDYMDDTAIRRKRALAEALMQQGSDTSPIRSPWQGVARLVQGLMGGMHEASADAAEKENNEYNAKAMQGYLTPSGGSSAPSAAPAMLAPPSTPATGSVAPKTANGDYLPLFAQSGSRWGVSPEYLSRTAQIESGMDPNAKNKSGAAGLMQFVPSTAKAYNLFNPFDANASVDAAGHLAADNKKVLMSSLGRQPSDAELYLAHQQGAGNAAKMLANPNTPAASIVGQNAVVQNGGNPNMTAGQFAGMWLNKFGGAPAAQPGPQMADNSGGVPAAPAAQNGQAQRILAAMADPRLSPQNKQVLMMMYQNATKDEGKPHYSAPHMDAQGNLVQEEQNSGQTHILTQAQRAAPTTPTREIQNFQYGKEHPDFAEAQKKAPTMDPDTVDFLAERVLAGDNSGLVGLGRGAQGAENIGAVQARVAQLAHERGIDATGMLRNMAHAAGMKAGARTLEQYNAKMGPLEKRVESAANYAADLSDKIPRGSVVPYNQLVQGIQKNLSDPNLRDLNVRINTLVNEYAAAVGGGNGTDATRAHAREMLSMADSPETFRRIVNSMVREVQFSHQAARDALGEMYNPAGEGGAPSPAPTAAPAGQTKSGVKWTVE